MSVPMTTATDRRSKRGFMARIIRLRRQVPGVVGYIGLVRRWGPRGAMFRIAIATTIWLTCLSPLSAQSPAPSVGTLLRTARTDFQHIFSVENGLIVAGAAGVAAAILPHEKQIVRLATLADGMDDAFNYATVGHGLVQVGGSAAVYLTGRFTHRSALTRVGGRLLRAQAVSGAMTHAVKFVVRRRRPDGGPYSFPSGHTSAAFATATTLQRELGWDVGIPAYVVASYIGTSRAAGNKHYVSDLVVGAAIGIVAGRAVVPLPHTGNTVTVSPLVSASGTGFTLTWTPKH